MADATQPLLHVPLDDQAYGSTGNGSSHPSAVRYTTASSRNDYHSESYQAGCSPHDNPGEEEDSDDSDDDERIHTPPDYSDRPSAYYKQKLQELNDRVSRMTVPTKPAEDWYMLLLGLIGLCVVCCCCLPIAFPYLICAWFTSKMVKERNEEKDYFSARTCSWVTLCCVITSFVMVAVFWILVIIFAPVVHHEQTKHPPVPGIEFVNDSATL